jgi:microcystin-dependent protein
VTVGATTIKGTASVPTQGALLAQGFDIEFQENANNFSSVPGATVPISGPSVSIQSSYSLGPSGVGQPHDNMMPFQALTYYIAVQGVFPSPP